MKSLKNTAPRTIIISFTFIAIFLFTGASNLNKVEKLASQMEFAKDPASPLDSRISGVLPIETARYYERNYLYYMNFMVKNKPSDPNAYEESEALVKAIERSQSLALDQAGCKIVYGLKNRNESPKQFIQIVYPIDAKGNVLPLKRGYINVHCVFIPNRNTNEKSSLVCPPYCD